MSEYSIRIARLEDAHEIARVHTESWRTTYTGVMPDGFLAELSIPRRTVYWSQILQSVSEGAQKAVWVACAPNGQVIGILAGGESRDPDLFEYDMELYAVYLLKEHQRKGIGSRLVAEFAQWVRSKKLENFFLWVLEGNPYESFYAKVGGRRLEIAKPIEFGGKMFRERAYGWQDLTHL